MVLELHIWGPAFGLPSIDAGCLAITAYFVHCLPPAEWRLIASSESLAGPASELPALRSGSTWIIGFSPIVDFVRRHSGGKWDLDHGLSPEQLADSVAFSCFLESVGRPLLDLSLYVSSGNYTQWTRPALAEILQWPQQWLIPHRLRDQAKIRSEHLGLSSLDIESAAEETGTNEAKAAGNIPKSLLTAPKDTVASMLGVTGGRNRFRLEAVTSNLFEPICELVERNGAHSWVFGTDQASSLDCLLLGYVSLMCPPLRPPHTWLQDALSTKYPVLLQWTQNFRQECFDGPVSAADAFADRALTSAGSSTKLPWQARAPRKSTEVALAVLRTVFDALPLAPHQSDRVVRTSSRNASEGTSEPSGMVWLSQSPIFGQWKLVGSALGLMLSYTVLQGVMGRSERPQQIQHVFRGSSLSQRKLGEAGRMLGLL